MVDDDDVRAVVYYIILCIYYAYYMSTLHKLFFVYVCTYATVLFYKLYIYCIYYKVIF